MHRALTFLSSLFLSFATVCLFIAMGLGSVTMADDPPDPTPNPVAPLECDCVGALPEDQCGNADPATCDPGPACAACLCDYDEYGTFGCGVSDVP